jgi:hypothetical protein
MILTNVIAKFEQIARRNGGSLDYRLAIGADDEKLTFFVIDRATGSTRFMSGSVAAPELEINVEADDIDEAVRRIISL